MLRQWKRSRLRGRCARRCLVLGTALLGVATRAAAQAAEPIQLTYEGTPTCGSLEDFWVRIRTRTDRARPAERGEAGRVFVVRVEVGAHAAHGRLKIVTGAGAATERQITTSGCEEALEGLSLIVALTIDPTQRNPGEVSRTGSGSTAPAATSPAATASNDPLHSESSRASIGNSASASVPSPGQQDAGDRGDAGSKAGPLRQTTSRESTTAEHTPQTNAEWRLAAGAHGIAGMAPAPLWGVHASLERAARTGGWWAPAWRMSGGYSWQRGYAVEVAGATANFQYWHTSADVCLLKTPTNIVGLWACATGDAGILYAWGSDTPTPHSVLRFWADLGAFARAHWVLASPVRLELGLGLLVPLRQDRFRMGAYSFHEVPPLCIRGEASVSVAFP